MSQTHPENARIAMRYLIPLQAGQTDAVRQRVAEIGPAFDALPGLVAKLFLLADDNAPTYSLYYIWETPNAMQAFLEGQRFAAVIAKYGRPGVTTYLTTDRDILLAPGDRLEMDEGRTLSAEAANSFQDPATGTNVELRRLAQGRHEVLYVARNPQTHARLERAKVAQFSHRLGELL